MSTSSQSNKDFESPATVSEKLNILLQSMPRIDSVNLESDMKFRRTSSLRLGKSASFEVLSSPTTDEGTENKKVGRSNSFQVHLQGTSSEESPKNNGPVYSSSKKNRPADPVTKKEDNTSSKKPVNSNYSRHLRRTHSFDILPKNDDDKQTVEKSGGDNFSSLKAKLKSYRDYLLSKSDDTKQKKSSLTTNDSSPLKRSNSFTFNWLKRRSNSLDSGDAGKTQESDRQSKDTEDGSNKKVPQVLNTLNVPRSTFKPHSSLSIQRSAQKKSGPMKALSSALTSNDKKHTADPNLPVKVANGNVKKTADLNSPVKVANGNVKKDETAESKNDNLDDSDRQRKNSSRRGSKEETQLVTGTYTPKTAVDINPFGSIGGSNSMWRPMSMRGKSTIKDDSEETRTYTNFDALRDITAGRTPQGTDSKVTRKPPPRPAAPPDVQKTAVNNITSSVPNGEIRQRTGSISEESFAIVSDKISESHSDSVKLILGKKYKCDEFDEATKDVDRLLVELKQTLETLKDSRIDRRPKQFGMCKEELNNRVKQFVYDAKFLVSNATQTKDKLAENLDQCMHTLAKVFLHAQATMIMMVAVHQAQQLGFEVIKVTNAFKSTVNAAQAACGKPLSDPHMRYLMRQATNLATLLSSLLKHLKTLEQK